MKLQSQKKSYIGAKILIHSILILFVVITLIPFYWMFVNSLKTTEDFYSVMKSLFPERPVLENYVKLFTQIDFAKWSFNSIIVSALSTILGVVICSMAGFAFGMYRFRFKTLFFWLVLCSVAIPEVVTIIPIFKLMANLKLIDTYASLVLPFAVSMFGIFLMKQYIESSLPKELLEAARIDGMSELNIYIKIAIPLIKPGLGVLAIFLWLTSWSSYFWPLIMLKSREMMTITLGLASLYSDPWNLEYGMLMAGSVVSTIPIILLFLFAQEQFISGLTTGSVKG